MLFRGIKTQRVAEFPHYKVSKENKEETVEINFCLFYVVVKTECVCILNVNSQII